MSKAEAMLAEEELTEVNELLAEATPIGDPAVGGRAILSAADDGDGVWAGRLYPDSSPGRG